MSIIILKKQVEIICKVNCIYLEHLFVLMNPVQRLFNNLTIVMPPLAGRAFRFAHACPSVRKSCDKGGKMGASVSYGHISFL